MGLLKQSFRGVQMRESSEYMVPKRVERGDFSSKEKKKLEKVLEDEKRIFKRKRGIDSHFLGNLRN